MKMIPRNNLKRDVTLKTLEEMAAKTKNWGKWGPDDQLGTLNYVTPEDIVRAAALVKKGKAFALGLDFNSNGPQRTGWGGRFNPIHTMLATGTDAVAGTQDAGKIRYADDMVSMPLQCGTQWDALGHIFYGDRMWNGYDARLVDSTGAKKNGIHKTRDRMTGRGVLLDIPRFLGGDYLEDGYGIGNAELDACAKAQGVEVRRGDFVIVRTGQMEHCLARGRLGRLRRGRRAGAALRDLRVDTPERDRRDLLRHLGLRGAPQREHGGVPALALDRHSHDRDHHGRDLLPQGPRRRLREGQGVRVPLLRAAAADHRARSARRSIRRRSSELRDE